MQEPANGHERPVKLRDVATLAGVDISTASRALSGQRKVASETIKRVNEAAAALGFVPNQAARNLRLSRTMTLGVVINRFDSPIYLDALEGMGSTSHEAGYELMITSARADADLYKLLVQRLFDRRVDGLILWMPPRLGGALDPFLNLNIPALAIGIHETWSPPIPHISVTEARPIHDAMQRLAALGHRTLFYLKVPLNISRPRMPALRQETAHAGIRFIDEAFARDRPMVELCDLLRRQLGPPINATAILADHHHLAQVTAALHMIDVQVPEDVSLIGFARSRWAQESWLPTATIQTDAVQQGRVVAQMMLDWLGGTRPPNLTDLHLSEWVERESVGPAPIRP
jgi:DNA-binding LacI/PurR family transcriptional regulator